MIETRSTFRLWRTQKEYLKNIIGTKIHYGVMVILHLLSEMLVKRQQNIIYGIRVEVDAYIP